MHDPAPGDLDPFAEHLRAQLPRDLPAHWRGEVLAAALRAASPAIPPPRWHRAAGMLGAWLWPHPVAYTGLAVVWPFIIAMRLSTSSPETGPVVPDANFSFAGPVAPGNGVSIFESVRLTNQEAYLLSVTDNRP